MKPLNKVLQILAHKLFGAYAFIAFIFVSAMICITYFSTHINNTLQGTTVFVALMTLLIIITVCVAVILYSRSGYAHQGKNHKISSNPDEPKITQSSNSRTNFAAMNSEIKNLKKDNTKLKQKVNPNKRGH